MRKFAIPFLIATLVLSFFPQAQAAKAAPNTIGLFGYDLTYLTSPWEEIGNATEITYTNPDNGYGDPPLLLPFDFQFFENTYAANSPIYVSANGFITFNLPQEGYSVNKPIPQDELPNNIIAPFWDDLAFGGDYPAGKVTYKYEPSPKRLIIQWSNVTQKSNGQQQTFQLVLSQNVTLGYNAIEFRYYTINDPTGHATVGIEDSDGVDGILVPSNKVFNGGGAHFGYPGNGYRFKAYPKYNSLLLRTRTAVLPVTVHNTSTVGTGYEPDNYNISWVKDPSWTVTPLSTSGQVLSDTDADGNPNTGLIASGASLRFMLRLTAPLSVPVGNSYSVEITLKSTKPPFNEVKITRQAAVSASFVQGFSDPQGGTQIQAANHIQNVTRQINPPQDYYHSLSIAYTSQLQYITAWVYGSGMHYNIKYALVNLVSGGNPSIKQLTNNPDYTFDDSIAVATAPNGTIGVAFRRKEQDSHGSDAERQNVYFARIDPAGNKIGDEVNITQNTVMGTPNEVGVQFFSGISISATAENRFVIAWSRQQKAPSSEINQDIFDAVYSAVDGQPIDPINRFRILTTPSGNTSYYSPNLSQLNSGNDTFLTYLAITSGGGTTTYNLYGVTLAHDGTLTSPALSLTTNINASQIDTTQLSGGNLLAAWIDNATLTPRYAVWMPGATAVVKPALNSPDNRSMSQIAVTSDSADHGIITWGDLQGNRMYYALVSGNGNLVTPAMIQRSSDTAPIHLGSSVHSTAFLSDLFVGFVTNFPFVRR